MQKLYKYGLTFFLVTSVVACAPTSNDNNNKFFDVPGFFKNEITRFNSQEGLIQKNSVYNNDSSEVSLNLHEVNWEKEWNVFLQSNINKPAYYASMTVDSTQSVTSYATTSSKLPIKKVVLKFKEGTPIYVELETHKSNLISSTELNGRYYKDSLWLVTGTQKIKLFNRTNRFRIVGKLSFK